MRVNTSQNIKTKPSKKIKQTNWMAKLAEAQEEMWDKVRNIGDQLRYELSDKATYVLDDAIHFMSELPPCSIHAIVTDPPYGLIEYNEVNLSKKRNGKGGVWRIPPSFDGVQRSPLPRFTVLSVDELANLQSFFSAIAYGAYRALVPGGHVFIASNPLLSSMTFHAFQEAGFEKRGEIIRQVQTLRGGYKPKGSEDEFPEVSVMPRSCWEPWGMFRKPFEGTVAQNLKAWGAGGLRRPSADEPMKDLHHVFSYAGNRESDCPAPLA